MSTGEKLLMIRKRYDRKEDTKLLASCSSDMCRLCAVAPSCASAVACLVAHIGERDDDVLLNDNKTDRQGIIQFLDGLCSDVPADHSCCRLLRLLLLGQYVYDLLHEHMFGDLAEF
jgi:hypothetical protein